MEDILKNAKTIAVIGASTKRSRASNRIVRYLIQEGFQVIPVNPHYEIVEGMTSHRSIEDIPVDEEIDIFTIFRNPRFTLDTVDSIIKWAKRAGTKPVIWTQLGVSNFEAQKLATDADFQYVANRCIMVEHSTLPD